MGHKSVYSNVRTVVQPELDLAPDLKLDQLTIMDGWSFLSKITSDTIPLVFFDPQYRSVLDKQKYGNEGTRQKDRALLPQMDDELITRMITQIDRVLLPSGHLMLWVDKYLLVQGWQHLTHCSSLQSVDLIIWDKGRIGMGYRTRRCSEFLLVLQKPPVRAKGVWKLHDIRDVWSEPSDKTHPHAKPIGLAQRLIQAVTNEADVVVDPAAGGYGVMRAALQQRRHFLGCDILEHHLSPAQVREIQYMTAPIDAAGYIDFSKGWRPETGLPVILDPTLTPEEEEFLSRSTLETLRD